MKKSEFMRKEFVGLEMEVSSSSHPAYLNVKGRVSGETKNTILVDIGPKEVTVPKPGNEFLFTYEGERFTVKGSEIQHRPEDRIKKIR
jgi:ribonuclease P protein subunit POP4